VYTQPNHHKLETQLSQQVYLEWPLFLGSAQVPSDRIFFEGTATEGKYLDMLQIYIAP
jgi:hypothetical protein